MVFVIGSCGSAMSQTLPQLMIARVVMGVGQVSPPYFHHAGASRGATSVRLTRSFARRRRFRSSHRR